MMATQFDALLAELQAEHARHVAAIKEIHAEEVAGIKAVHADTVTSLEKVWRDEADARAARAPLWFLAGALLGMAARW